MRPSLQDRAATFLGDFFANGEALIRDLLAENARLSDAVRAVDGTPSGLGGPPVLEGLIERVQQLQIECAELRGLAGSMQRESEDSRRRLDDLEREHYNLAARYVATTQINCATTLDEVLRTITEILLNFVGVGRFTLLGVDEERRRLFVLWQEGNEGVHDDELPLPPAGALGEMLAGRERPWRATDPVVGDADALMYLPLCAGSRLVGVVRIEGFLPQKSAFAADDFNMLELVSECAGIGCETAWIRACAQRVPFARKPLQELIAR